MATVESNIKDSTPVILLKNPSAGHIDPYTSHFVADSPSSSSSHFQPIYVPVLEHTYDTGPMLRMLSDFCQRTEWFCDTSLHFPYGGFIFTSQRAVEAFAAALDSVGPKVIPNFTQERLDMLRLLAIPLYAVGPATARSLEELRRVHLPCSWVEGGEQTGTGELLAKEILWGYNAYDKMKTTSRPKRPLLFFAGDKHRDIVPDTLMSAPGDERIEVETMVVYATSESPSFASNIQNILNTTSTARFRWIVIFSPTGGESLLRALGWLPGSDDMDSIRRTNPGTFIATIGPTTKDYMKTTFGISVDVCAKTPSPDGVRKGIETFMRTQLIQP